MSVPELQKAARDLKAAESEATKAGGRGIVRSLSDNGFSFTLLFDRIVGLGLGTPPLGSWVVAGDVARRYGGETADAINVEFLR